MSSNTPRHFVDIADLKRGELEEILAMAEETRRNLEQRVVTEPQILAGSATAFLSTKESLRTTDAIAQASARLGGGFVYLGKDSTVDETGKPREPLSDMTKCLDAQGCPVIFARLGPHTDIMEMVEAAENASVVNALTDDSHPTQAVADIEALRIARPSPDKYRIVFSGDGNNVAVSLEEALPRYFHHQRIRSYIYLD